MTYKTKQQLQLECDEVIGLAGDINARLATLAVRPGQDAESKVVIEMLHDIVKLSVGLARTMKDHFDAPR